MAIKSDLYGMNNAPYYLVEGETFRELVRDKPSLPYPIEEAELPPDKLDWLPGEFEYYLYLLGLAESFRYVASTLIGKSGRKPVEQIFLNLDINYTQNIWKNKPAADKFIEKFYKTGKTQATKQFKAFPKYGIADNHALYFLKHYNFEQVTNLTDAMRREIRRTIWKGVAEGQSMPQIARGLRSKAITKPLTIIGKDGRKIRTISPELRARMIARTETMRATNQGALLSYQQYGIQNVAIYSAGDDRVCGLCKRVEGGNPYNIWKVPMLPLHPFCRCTYAAWLKDIINPFWQDISTYINLVTQEKTTIENEYNIYMGETA